MDTIANEFSKNQNLVYTELGKFNVIFEHTNHSFKSCIKDILKTNGLEDRAYADCLVDKLTAEPIKSIFQSIIALYLKREDDKKTINKIISIFSDLIEIRNVFMHCFWAIGTQGEDPVVPFIFGIKTRISKKGVSAYNLDFELKDLIALNKKLIKFKDLVYELKKLIKNNNANKIDLDPSLIEELNFSIELNKIKSDLK